MLASGYIFNCRFMHFLLAKYKYQEYKANSFMYHACIPTFMLNELSINDYSSSTVLKVSKLFQVEYDFALKRLTQYIQNKHFMQYSHSK